MSYKNISATNLKKIYKFMNLHKHSDLFMSMTAVLYEEYTLFSC